MGLGAARDGFRPSTCNRPRSSPSSGLEGIGPGIVPCGPPPCGHEVREGPRGHPTADRGRRARRRPPRQPPPVPASDQARTGHGPRPPRRGHAPRSIGVDPPARRAAGRAEMSTLRSVVRIGRDPGSDWGASVPDLPGCIATGRTLDSVLRRIQGSTVRHLAGLRQDGRRAPRPRSRVVLPGRRSRSPMLYTCVEVVAQGPRRTGPPAGRRAAQAPPASLVADEESNPNPAQTFSSAAVLAGRVRPRARRSSEPRSQWGGPWSLIPHRIRSGCRSSPPCSCCRPDRRLLSARRRVGERSSSGWQRRTRGTSATR